MDWQRFKEGYTVRLHLAGGERPKNVEIIAVAPLPTHRHDFGALTAGTASTRQACSHLQLSQGQFGQFRFVVADPGFEVQVRQPRSSELFHTQGGGSGFNDSFRVRPWIFDPTEPEFLQETHFRTSEFWVHEDDDPQFDLYPYNSAQNSQGHVDFMGYKYAYREIGDPGAVDLWISSFPG
jgi:hypothetical protein